MKKSEIKLKILYAQKELETSKTKLMLEQMSIEALEKMISILENQLSKESYDEK